MRNIKIHNNGGKDAIRRRRAAEKAFLRELRDALNMARIELFRKVFETLFRVLNKLDPQGEFGWKSAVLIEEYLDCLRKAAFNATFILEEAREGLEAKDAQLEEMDAQLREMTNELYLAMETLRKADETISRLIGCE